MSAIASVTGLNVAYRKPYLLKKRIGIFNS